MFKPGVTDTNKEDKLAAWFSTSSIDYIKNPEEATHNASYVLDLSFLNISFATISIQTNIYYVSDHKVQVTIIPGRRKVLLEQVYYYILEAELSTFLALV
jgi:hypothetical protein